MGDTEQISMASNMIQQALHNKRFTVDRELYRTATLHTFFYEFRYTAEG